jgi:hypothetical protein
MKGSVRGGLQIDARREIGSGGEIEGDGREREMTVEVRFYV